MKWIAVAGLLAAIAPAAAQAPAFSPDDLLTVAGLGPKSTVADAEHLYGKNWHKMGAHGIEYMAAGSLADAWMTFRPGHAVYVDCGIVPANLPDDAASRLCAIATGSDWRQSLARLTDALRNGKPNGAVQAAFSADGPLSGPQTGKEDDDDKVFVEVSRTFVTQHYTAIVEVAPRITTKDGTSRAAVLVTWKAN
jgi:hypothetical protein